MRTLKPFLTAALFTFAVTGCGDDHDGHNHGNEEEVISAVALTFTPVAGGAGMTFEFDDPDGDGGDPPTIDNIDIAAGDYNLTIVLENRLEDPAEDITQEVSDEGDEHQLFFTGSAVNGPAANNPGAPLSHDYADQDMGGLPIGLSNTITAAAGTGDMTVVLRHLPPLNDQPTKVDGLAEDVAGGGISSIGGSSDVQVTLSVTVQ